MGTYPIICTEGSEFLSRPCHSLPLQFLQSVLHYCRYLSDQCSLTQGPTFPVKASGGKSKNSYLRKWISFVPFPPYYSPVRADNANMKIGSHGASVGFVFFLLKTKYAFLCLRDLNSIHFGSESAVSSDRFVPMCLTQTKDILRKRERK